MQYVNRRRMSLVDVTVLALLLTLASALPLAAATDVPAIKTANTPSAGSFMLFAGTTNDATIGWSFTVGAADIVVTHLGLYDSGADGFLTAHEVGIWTSAGTPVTPATAIPIGTGATLVIDGYRYVAITPVTLNAGGTYVIGAYFPTVPQFIPTPPPELQGDIIIWSSSQTYAAPITFGEPRTTMLNPTTDPLTFSNVSSTVAQGIFGPNFLCSFTELNIDNVTLNEGNAGTTSFDFTVSLTSPAGAGGVTFDIATADGTTDPATEPSDYTAKSLASQTIPSGSSTYTFSVLVNGDTDVEPNETFFVNVTNVTGAYLNDGQGLGTITNDDVAPVGVCPQSQGYWKNNPAAWPVNTLMLGTVSYDQSQLLDILNTPVGTGRKADASLILAYQLIAARLNQAAGVDVPPPVPATIVAADNAISGSAIPMQVRTNTSLGQTMTALAATLESYNKGLLNEGCGSTAKIVEDSEAMTSEIIPESFALEQNYPNPFNPSTTITFAMPEAGKVTLRIYSLTGQLVRQLANGNYGAGSHHILWDANDNEGVRVSSGVYFYKFDVQPENGGARFVQTRRMVLLK